jgi:L-asparaginase/Glu-tRNA(Gln) amidotransferase subunit D
MKFSGAYGDSYKVRTINPGKLISAESKVLMLYTGGTIGMINRGHGYEPLAKFLE